MMDKIDINNLSESVKKLILPTTPSGLKALAIKGLVPLKPIDYVIFLYLMFSEEDEEIRSLARKTFSELPMKILNAVLTQPLPGQLINELAIVYRSDRTVLEKIIMNNSTADETIEMIATFADEKLVDMISRNQVRILRHPKIVSAICNNPNSTASQKSMVMEFAEKSGLKVELPFVSAHNKSVRDEEREDLETELSTEEGEDSSKLEKDGEQLEPIFSSTKDSLIEPKSSKNKEELIKKFNIEREYYDESVPLPEEMEKKLIDDIETMSEERQLAFVEVGRHRVKQIMAKSPYPSVALAAVKHPDITKDDIYKIAQDRAANAEAIKYIATHRDYIRVYNIKLKLALNPKTPVPMAMAFVRSLRLSDLKNIAKNASVSKILQNTAKGIIKMHS
ncbi:MAG: hypothetical protein N2746_00525 [Deltaproteobacteria bacterium]|nr:hypothetical protein [Deltaproteobacteria bacterium]